MTGLITVPTTLTTVFTVQVPALQVLRLPHACPQLPQLFESVWKFMQPPLQQDGADAVQAFPQAPQLAASTDVFTHVPLQLVFPSTAQFMVSDPASVRPGLTVTPGMTVVVVVTTGGTGVVTAVTVVVTIGAGAEQVEALQTRPPAQTFPQAPQLVAVDARS
jgi:hypothetical protein